MDLNRLDPTPEQWEDMLRQVPEDKHVMFREEFEASSKLLKRALADNGTLEQHEQVHEVLSHGFMMALGRVNPRLPLIIESADLELIAVLLLTSETLRLERLETEEKLGNLLEGVDLG